MTTMTAEELRAIITPEVEADLKAAGLWPTRDGLQMLLPVPNEPNLSCGYASKDLFLWCHPDDARAQIERRLVSFLMKHYRQVNLVDSTTGVEVRTFDRSEEGRLRTYHGPTMLHALLAAFAGRNRTAPTGEKEGA